MGWILRSGSLQVCHSSVSGLYFDKDGGSSLPCKLGKSAISSGSSLQSFTKCGAYSLLGGGGGGLRGEVDSVLWAWSSQTLKLNQFCPVAPDFQKHLQGRSSGEYSETSL